MCTANVCRSPMGEALLRMALVGRRIDAEVSSAGLLESGRPSPEELVRAMAVRGADLGGRVSHQVEVADIEAAALILTMERAHLRELVLLDRRSWPRTFTLKEIVRRGDAVGVRARGETPLEWLARAGEGREPSELLGSSTIDDVDDPYMQGYARYEAVRDEIGQLLGRFVDLIWPLVAAQPARSEAAMAPGLATKPRSWGSAARPRPARLMDNSEETLRRL